jgi:hypothetical protein
VDVLWDRHRVILRRVSLGMTDTQISEDLDVSTVSVSTLKNSLLGQAQLNHLRQKADEVVERTQERIALLAPKAARLLEGFMNDSDCPYSVRAKVAESMLDRAGLAPVKKVESHNFNQHVSNQDIVELQRRLAAADIIVHVKAEERQEAEVVETEVGAEEIEAEEIAGE